MDSSRGGLRRDALRLLKARKSATQEDVTRLNRELADKFVALREHFLEASGHPDWRGKTYQYRHFIGEILTDAGYDREESKTALAAVRYHLGAALRARLGDDELERIGIMKETPRERSSQRRESRMSVVRALTSSDKQGGLLMALTATLRILALVPPEAYQALSADERAVAEQMIAEIRGELNRMSRELRRERPA